MTVTGSDSFHLDLDALDAGLSALPKPSPDRGRVVLVVKRPAVDERVLLDEALLSPEEGVPGDGWTTRPPRDPEAQLAVANHGVASLVANGQPVELFGDNLFVDLDLSAENLPLGTKLRVGEARVEVTAKPHNGCLKFKERFGGDALRFVQRKETRNQNLRGIYWRVTRAGRVAPGDEIEVLERPVSS